MFKKPTKKQFIIRRVILSVIATVSVAIIVTTAVLFMLGYRINSSDGTLQQGALLQFDSRPNNANVYVDGILVGGRTATKQAVVAGAHSVTIAKDGYEDWNHELTVKPGTLTWLNYTRLVPKERKPQSVQRYEALAQIEFSPDYKWAIAHEAPDSPSFHYIDLRSEQVKSQILTLPTSLYSEAESPDVAHTFTIVRWNTPSRHVLIRHEYAGKLEWLVLDTHDISRSTNVTRSLNAGFKDIQFAGTNGSSLYGLTDDGLIRKLDLGAGTMSRAFITHVSGFRMFSTNILVYTGMHPEKENVQVAGVYRDGDEASNILREVEGDTPLRIATGEYFGDDYVAIAEGNEVTVLKGTYPRSQAQSATASLRQYAVFEAPGTVGELSFSISGEYIIAQVGAQFVSYDIEYKRVARGVSTEATEGVRPLSWLDAAHLWNDTDGNLTMRDFDGTNTHTIMRVAPGYDTSLSQNGRFLYAIGKTDTGYSLQRVRMILE